VGDDSENPIPMRTPTLLFLLAVLAASLALPVGAEESAPRGALTGFDCENLCPLAHQANALRALGGEALTVDGSVHKDLVQLVRKNLGRI
jgi:hypothetical protein